MYRSPCGWTDGDSNGSRLSAELVLVSRRRRCSGLRRCLELAVGGESHSWRERQVSRRDACLWLQTAETDLGFIGWLTFRVQRSPREDRCLFHKPWQRVSFRVPLQSASSLSWEASRPTSELRGCRHGVDTMGVKTKCSNFWVSSLNQ